MLELATAHPDWAWFALGIFLIIVEVLLFSAVLIWFGSSAILTGLITMVFNISWQTQVVSFSLLSLLLLVFFKYFRKNTISSEPNKGYQLNKRATHYIGKTVQVSQEIKNGRGRVAVGDTSWKASGPDCAQGTQVIVKEVDGDRLVVELIS